MTPQQSAFGVTGQFDSRDVKALLYALAPRQWAFATAMTLTRVGSKVKIEELAAVARLDRPTYYTEHSLYLQKATIQRQQARVWFKDKDFGGQKGTPAGQYLQPLVTGGERPDKRFEKALAYKGLLHRGKQLVPASGATRNQYGNVAGGGRIYSRLLSQLQASNDPTQNETPKARRRNRNKARGRYFYGNPGGKGWGVWERIRGGRVLGGRHIVPIFLEGKRHVYRVQLPFFAIAEQTIDASMQPEFARSVDDTLRTARR
jgi:hypothetical protein